MTAVAPAVIGTVRLAVKAAPTRPTLFETLPNFVESDSLVDSRFFINPSTCARSAFALFLASITISRVDIFFSFPLLFCIHIFENSSPENFL